MLRGDKIFLRAIEAQDATKILLWENNPEHWRVSGTESPFSLEDIINFINSEQGFRQSGQLRLIICKKSTDQAIGALDLFEANFKHGRAGVGILIGEESEKNKGYATESLNLLVHYAKTTLKFHNLTANVLADNTASIRLFEAAGYELIGIRKDWFFDQGK